MQVGAEEILETFFSGIKDILPLLRGDSRIINQQIQTSELIFYFSQHPGSRFAIADIALAIKRVWPKRRDGFTNFVFGTGSADGEPESLASQCLSDSEADAPGSACNQSNALIGFVDHRIWNTILTGV